MSKKIFWFLLAALAVAALLGPYASSYPDGLERVAEDFGFLGKSEGKAVLQSPMPDYVMPGITDEKGATALAGAVGTLLTFVIIYIAGKAITFSKRMSRRDRYVRS
ncbi:PDGLE domain-containing protein [Zhaonella formicivorans]|uniref:PDGLE domain-containing protein n=1 Tax=Zhaonella formicivorans TaxID=2528593 RepID=UPI0010D98C98|nr:PDGLE domain-containing protein [Zhaonella formicivorans]